MNYYNLCFVVGYLLWLVTIYVGGCGFNSYPNFCLTVFGTMDCYVTGFL